MRVHKKTLGLTILLVVGIFGLSVLTGIGGSQHERSAGLQKEDDPTPVEEGRMTDKQREHSRLYKAFGDGKKLKDIASQISGDVKVKRNTPLPAGETAMSPNPSEFLRGLACGADAVVIAVLKNKTSQLTEDGDFVFTDYQLTIDDVLKDNAFAHLIPNISLTLTQPGGRVRLDGYIIEAEDASFKPLVIGQRYALFLKFIPSTGDYASLNSASTYELRENNIKAQSEEAVRSELQNEKVSTFIEKVRVIANTGCVPKGAKND